MFEIDNKWRWWLYGSMPNDRSIEKSVQLDRNPFDWSFVVRFDVDEYWEYDE